VVSAESAVFLAGLEHQVSPAYRVTQAQAVTAAILDTVVSAVILAIMQCLEAIRKNSPGTQEQQMPILVQER